VESCLDSWQGEGQQGTSSTEESQGDPGWHSYCGEDEEQDRGEVQQGLGECHGYWAFV
jgi:hypothetical protein